MNAAVSWLVILALLFLAFRFARFVEDAMDWVLDHLGWSASPNVAPVEPAFLLFIERRSDSEAPVVRVPEGYVRCPGCWYFVPVANADPDTHVCEDCSGSIDADWADLQRAIDDERAEGEDHR